MIQLVFQLVWDDCIGISNACWLPKPCWIEPPAFACGTKPGTRQEDGLTDYLEPTRGGRIRPIVAHVTCEVDVPGVEALGILPQPPPRRGTVGPIPVVSQQRVVVPLPTREPVRVVVRRVGLTRAVPPAVV